MFIANFTAYLLNVLKSMLQICRFISHFVKQITGNGHFLSWSSVWYLVKLFSTYTSVLPLSASNYTSWLKWLKHCVDVGFKRSIICQRFTRDSTEMKSIVFTLVGPSIWKGITEMPKSAGGSSSHAGVSSLWSGPVGNKNWKTLNNAPHTLTCSLTQTQQHAHFHIFTNFYACRIIQMPDYISA